jgi:hypothetical protein
MFWTTFGLLLLKTHLRSLLQTTTISGPLVIVANRHQFRSSLPATTNSNEFPAIISDLTADYYHLLQKTKIPFFLLVSKSSILVNAFIYITALTTIKEPLKVFFLFL